MRRDHDVIEEEAARANEKEKRRRKGRTLDRSIRSSLRFVGVGDGGGQVSRICARVRAVCNSAYTCTRGARLSVCVCVRVFESVRCSVRNYGFWNLIITGRSFVSTVITLTPVGRHNCEMNHRARIGRRASARYGGSGAPLRINVREFAGLHSYVHRQCGKKKKKRNERKMLFLTRLGRKCDARTSDART